MDDVNEHVLMIDGSRGITIDGALLRHKKPLKEYDCHGSVVFLKGCDGITLIRCDLNGCGAIGVNGRDSRNIIVKKCLIHKNTFCGFYLDKCMDVKITDNIIEYNGVSVTSRRGNGLEMYNNVIRNNGGYWE